MLLNILRRNVKDERVIQWIKRYLKSGVMENGVVMEAEEGSPQGGLCRAWHKPPYVEIDIMPSYSL
jgi:retron-type reverse transcriptase